MSHKTWWRIGGIALVIGPVIGFPLIVSGVAVIPGAVLTFGPMVPWMLACVWSLTS